MYLNKQTGELSIFDIKLSPESKSDVLPAIEKNFQMKLHENGNYHQHVLQNLPDNILMEISFFKKIIISIHFYLKETDFEPYSTCKEFVDMTRDKFADLGPEGKYPWGSFSVYGDKRAGIVAAFIDYRDRVANT